MATIYGFGSKLITDQKLDAMTSSEIAGLTQRAGPQRKAATGTPTPFSAIGLGHPLSIEIAYVHTGGLSSRGVFGGAPGMLITSAVKRLPVFDSAPRAVNLIVKRVPENLQFADIAADTVGTPLVYYSPALTDRGTAVTVELVFDRFSEDDLTRVGTLLGTAAGLPMFAPASAYLMAGGVLVKLFSKFAEYLTDGRQSFSETLSIDIDRPGLMNTQPGFAILTNSDEIEALVDARQLEFTPKAGLRQTSTGKPYNGTGAYVVLTLDGTERADYASFAPTIASAALLSKFLHLGQQQSTGTDLILQSMKAFNDLHFRSKADAIKRRLTEAPQEGDERKKLAVMFDAYVKNISEKDLRPTL
jgi:hypothetical protein